MTAASTISVFLGVPAVLSQAQRTWRDAWLDWLHGNALDVHTLPRERYAPQPWEQLLEAIGGTHGVVLLGFEQLDARGARWRPATAEAARVDTGWSSPWLQVEAGMAVALGLPLLVVADDDVAEGAFAPQVWGGRVHGTTVEAPDTTRDTWLHQVRTSTGRPGRPEKTG